MANEGRSGHSETCGGAMFNIGEGTAVDTEQVSLPSRRGHSALVDMV